MNLPPTLSRAARRLLPSRRSRIVVGVAVVAALAIGATSVIVTPTGPSADAKLAAYIEKNAQLLTVPAAVVPAAVIRDTYSATPGVDTLVAGGTNYDWAKLVLLYGGFPMTDSNVTVLTRWMRQENGPEDWYNRNNPLNNGWGSGGGGGTGSYDSLVSAAQNAAAALHGNAGYGGIVDALASSAPTDVVESAIWASPWASGHYANGGHWAYTEVPIVSAPADSW